VKRATSPAASGSGKHCCTGPTIVERFERAALLYRRSTSVRHTGAHHRAPATETFCVNIGLIFGSVDAWPVATGVSGAADVTDVTIRVMEPNPGPGGESLSRSSFGGR
jgi:hypothetical protein